MNITKDIVEKLQNIDLSTETAVMERYEALANSPLLMRYILPNSTTEVRDAYQASGKNPKVIAGIFRDKLKEYATIERTLNKRRTIKAIRRHIGDLFAMWEAEEKAGGCPAKDGYIYAYAIEKGFDPDRTSLSEADTAALDEVAECIFTTIEAYVIYSLTGAETAVDCLLSHEIGDITVEEEKNFKEETKRQFDVLFAGEWENAGDELTGSFEEECNFFGDEATAYVVDFINALSKDFRFNDQARMIKSYAYEKEAAQMEYTKKTKYNEYVKANKSC